MLVAEDGVQEFVCPGWKKPEFFSSKWWALHVDQDIEGLHGNAKSSAAEGMKEKKVCQKWKKKKQNLGEPEKKKSQQSILFQQTYAKACISEEKEKHSVQFLCSSFTKAIKAFFFKQCRKYMVLIPIHKFSVWKPFIQLCFTPCLLYMLQFSFTCKFCHRFHRYFWKVICYSILFLLTSPS